MFNFTDHIVLSLDHLQGSFALFILCIALCIIVFIIELTSITKIGKLTQKFFKKIYIKFDNLLSFVSLKEIPLEKTRGLNKLDKNSFHKIKNNKSY